MPRRRHTRVGEEPCSFRFTVTWDTHGFYVVLIKYSGNPEHARHFKVTDPGTAPRLLV